MLYIKTKLGMSRIDGIGLFADQFVSEGTIIWQFNPLIDLRLDEKQISELPTGTREQIQKYSYREIHTGFYVLCGDDARFFNHLEKPNCLDAFHNQKEDLTVAGRDIEKREELTCNYALFDLDCLDGKYKFSSLAALAVKI